MFFKPTGSSSALEVQSINDIIDYMGEHLNGFTHIEIDKNRVIGYISNDPTGICIGTVY